MKIKRFTELVVWQKAFELALLVYGLTQKFPRTEQFGLVSQMRRSAASICANIAEGFGRGTTREFLQSLRVARGEVEETRCMMMLSCKLQFI